VLLKSPQWVRFYGVGFFIFRLKVWEILNHKLFLSLKTNFQYFFGNWALSLRSSSELEHWHHHVHIWFTCAPCNIDDGVKMKHFFWLWSCFLYLSRMVSYVPNIHRFLLPSSQEVPYQLSYLHSNHLHSLHTYYLWYSQR
jgi:hypothetical protein